MKMKLKMGFAAVALATAIMPEGHAQTAATQPDNISRPSSTAATTDVIVQTQLTAPGAAQTRMGGDEADAIYKRYLAGMGHAMTTTGSATSGASKGGIGYQ